MESYEAPSHCIMTSSLLLSLDVEELYDDGKTGLCQPTGGADLMQIDRGRGSNFKTIPWQPHQPQHQNNQRISVVCVTHLPLQNTTTWDVDVRSCHYHYYGHVIIIIIELASHIPLQGQIANIVPHLATSLGV